MDLCTDHMESPTLAFMSTCRYENECECQLVLKEMLQRLNKVSCAYLWALVAWYRCELNARNSCFAHFLFVFCRSHLFLLLSSS